MQQRSSTVFFIFLAAFFVKASSLTIERFDHKQEEKSKTIDTSRELPTDCKVQMETLQRQITEPYLEVLERLKNSIRSMSLKLQETEKKLLSYSNLQDLFLRVKRVKREETDQQDKDSKDKDSMDNFANCSEAIQNITDKHTNLIIKLLEESTAEVKKECSKPKLCFNQNAVLLSTGAHFFNPEWLNWTAARAFCLSRGMDLVAIESEDENKAIASHGLSFGAPFTATNAWTSGCYNNATEPDQPGWFWHSTNHTLTYQNWWKNHGNLTVDGNCIVLDSSDTTFLVKNKSELRPFICEL